MSAPEYTLYVRRYAPFKSFGGGFEGDGRGFSTSLDVTSRTVGLATFQPIPGGQVGGSGHSSGSAWVGPWEVRKKFPWSAVATRAGQVRVTVSDVTVDQRMVAFTVYTEGSLPLKDHLLFRKLAQAVDKANQVLRPGSPNPQGTPDIDTFVDFTADFGGRRVVFEGTVRGDPFPNAEVFVTDAAGKAVGLFDYRTKSNEAGPLYRIFGAHPDNRLGTFRRHVDLNPDGSFAGDIDEPPVAVREV